MASYCQSAPTEKAQEPKNRSDIPVPVVAYTCFRSIASNSDWRLFSLAQTAASPLAEYCQLFGKRNRDGSNKDTLPQKLSSDTVDSDVYVTRANETKLERIYAQLLPRFQPDFERRASIYCASAG